MSTVTPDLRSLDEASLAERYGALVDQTISPADAMYHGSLPHYFRVGYSGLRLIHLSLTAAGAPAPRSILDLPCGHGRVLRLLRVAFPEAEITAADLDREAVDFCASRFGAVPVYSAPKPADIALPRSFDLLWCGSLMTHLSADRWHAFLELFRDHTNPGGVAVFTTHGALTAEWMRCGQYLYALQPAQVEQVLADYRARGFGYSDYGAGSEYGVSVSSPAWVHDAVAHVSGWRLVAHFPRAWDDHHDVWACLRE
jgi:SAM-dependent methyltransferase